MLKLNLIRVSFTSLIKILKNSDKDQNHMSNSEINDSTLLLRMGCTTVSPVKKSISKISTVVLSYRSIRIDPFKDASLVLNFAMSSQNNHEAIDLDFITPSESAVANHANL